MLQMYTKRILSLSADSQCKELHILTIQNLLHIVMFLPLGVLFPNYTSFKEMGAFYAAFSEQMC